jgi:hypothetical protein
MRYTNLFVQQSLGVRLITQIIAINLSNQNPIEDDKGDAHEAAIECNILPFTSPSPGGQYATARRLPPGPFRSDLRQLGVSLLRLYKSGLRANVEIIDKRTEH